MPAENAGVLCSLQSIPAGRTRRLRIGWQTNSSGVFRWEMGRHTGRIVSEKTVHKTASATGTIAVTLPDEWDQDLLAAQHSAQAVNTTERDATVDNELRTGMESRPARVNGPVWLVVTASTSAVHYGITEIEIEDD